VLPLLAVLQVLESGPLELGEQALFGLRQVAQVSVSLPPLLLLPLLQFVVLFLSFQAPLLLFELNHCLSVFLDSF